MRLRYLLETERDGRVIASIALPPTASLQKSRTPGVAITWTLGAEPVREHTRVRERAFSVGGVSGLESRLGANALGAPLFADGPTLFREFERFIEAYENNAAAADETTTGVRTTSRYRLVWRALDEEEALFVEPAGSTKSASSSSSARHTSR